MDQLSRQFKGLDPKDPAEWPALPRYLLCLVVTVLVVVALWYVWLQDSDIELHAERAKEVQLRDDYKKKLTQAVNLDALKKQREQVQQYVTQLEKQLPSKAEMDALLSDINQAGVSRGLQFELFKPGPGGVKEFYAELPISIKLGGAYHDLGAFASDISNLARIVTLNNVNLQANEKSGQLTLEAVAKTFPSLDKDEIDQGRRETIQANKAQKPPDAGGPGGKKRTRINTSDGWASAWGPPGRRTTR